MIPNPLIAVAEGRLGLPESESFAFNSLNVKTQSLIFDQAKNLIVDSNAARAAAFAGNERRIQGMKPLVKP